MEVAAIARTQAASKARQEGLPPRQDHVMDKINIEGVARLAKIGLFPVRAIVIGLDLNVGSCGQHSLPATEQIATAELDILLNVRHKLWRVTTNPLTLPRIAFVDVPLKRHRGTL